MFSLLKPCELLFFLVLLSVLLRLVCVACLRVNLWLLAIFLGVVVILLFNVLEVLSVGGGAIFLSVIPVCI